MIFTIVFIINWLIFEIIGEISERNKNKTIIPYLSIENMKFLKLYGATAKRILEPSKGGIGNRLKTASAIFKVAKLPSKRFKALK